MGSPAQTLPQRRGCNHRRRPPDGPAAAARVRCSRLVGPVDRGAERLVPFHRPPSPSRRESNRRSEPRASSAGLIAVTRAAASSIASGTPSSRRQICTTAAALSGVERRSRHRSPPARSANKRTASAPAATSRLVSSAGAPSDGTAHDPLAVERETLATRRQDAQPPDRSARAARRDPRRTSRRCSQLSTTNNSCFVRRNSARVSTRVWPARALTPNTAANAPTTPSGSRTAANSTNQAPSRNWGSTSPATWSARRVLPTPPTPVNVTTRDSASAFATRTSSRSRPMNELTCNGRFPGNASNVVNDGKSLDKPGRADLEHAAPPATDPASDAHPDRPAPHPRAARREPDQSSPASTPPARRARRHQPRRTIHRRPEVVAVTQRRRSRVHTHPHPQGLGQRPGLCVESALCRDRGHDSGIRGSECGVEPVACGLHHITAMAPRSRRATTHRDEPATRASRRDAAPTGASSPRCR